MKDCKYYCKDYQLEGMCKKHSNWSEAMPGIKYCLNSPCKDYEEDKYIILKSNDGREHIISKEKITVTDKYGDIMIVYSDGAICYRPNSPTYDELYEYWIKTKDKSKKKRKPEQLPGQLDIFDIIDKEDENE